MNDDVQSAADPIEVPADGETHETALADIAGTLVDVDGNPINPPPGDVNDEPTVIGASIEDAAPVAAAVEEEAPAAEPDAAHVPDEAEAADLGRPESEPIEEPAAIVPLAFERPMPSKDSRDVSTGVVWDIRDENRPSVVADKADLARRAALCGPYLELLKASESFEPNTVLHTPFDTFAIDESTSKALLAQLTDEKVDTGQLVRIDNIHRIATGGALHAGYARHEIATSLVMPLSSVLGLEPWPVEKPDVDALNVARGNAVEAPTIAALDA